MSQMKKKKKKKTSNVKCWFQEFQINAIFAFMLVRFFIRKPCLIFLFNDIKMAHGGRGLRGTVF